MKQKVVVVDYGMGNLHSMSKAVIQAGSALGKVNVLVTKNPDQVMEADRLILPGVGAMRDCVSELERSKFIEPVKAFIQAGKPLLGVCVGMQMMFQSSRENQGSTGLAVLPGHILSLAESEKVQQDHKLKVPHMGWNQVQQNAHWVWQGIPDLSRFYFVHGYYLPASHEMTIGKTTHGEQMSATLVHENLLLAQFHPEKSHHVGLQFLHNFLAHSF